MVIGGDLFSLVFGSEWQEAGVFAQILSLWIMIWFVTSVLSPIISVLEIQGFGLSTSTSNLVTRSVSLGIGGIVGSVYVGIWLFCFAGLLIAVYTLFIFMRRTGGSFMTVWQNINLEMVFGVVAFILLLLCMFIGISGFIVCCIAIVMGIGYVIWLISKNRLVKSYLFGKLQ